MLTTEHRTVHAISRDLESSIFALAQALEPAGISHLWGEYEGTNERAIIEKVYASFNGTAYFLIAQKDAGGDCDLLNINAHGNPKILACFKHLNRPDVETGEGQLGQKTSIVQSIERVFNEACKKFKIDFTGKDPQGDFYLDLKGLVVEIEDDSSTLGDRVTPGSQPTHRARFQ